MAKHTPIAISGARLLDMIVRHTDTNWREVIGWDHDELNLLDAGGCSLTEAEQERREELDDEEATKVAEAWWVVRWPDHVIHAQYNTDADYLGPMSEAEARAYEPGIEVYA